jgi:hypothetical protein
MVETALFVSATLIFMLGIIQIGVLGYLQLTTDAAAYYDARANVLTVTSGTPEQATHNAFPQISIANVQPTAVPAPTPSIAVDYGYNDPNPTVQANSASNRHGGASMMTPEQLQATVNVPGLVHILGNSLGVNGVAIEAKWVECGTHDDIANEGCSLASPGPYSQNNYFTQGENTPPYFVGFNYLQECSLPGPWGEYTGQGDSDLYWRNPSANSSGSTGYYNWFQSFNGAGPGSPAGSPPSNLTVDWSNGGTPCANGNNNGNPSISFLALGVAGFLDSTNWSDTSPGVSGASSTGTGQSVFEAFACHQRVYATIAEYLQANPYQPLVEWQSQEADPKQNPNNQIGLLTPVYDNGQGGAYAAGFTNMSVSADDGAIAIPEAIQSFGAWEGFTDNGHFPGQGGDQWNVAVQTVYGWDVNVGAGQPPNDPTYSNPTSPEQACP